MILNSNQIQQIIPHRYPYLMVDQIIELESGIRAVGIKAVTANEMHFMGHFPNHHVMPGVLIIEALAQVGAIVVLSLEQNKGKIAFFAGIKEAKFRKQVIPGDVIRLEVEILKMKASVGVGKAKAFVKDALVCEAELTFALGNA